MKTGVKCIEHPDLLKQVLKTHVLLTKIPVLIHGAPGIGKSEIVKAVAKEIGYQCRVLMLSQFPVEDIAGLPIPVKNSEGFYKTLRSLPDFLPAEGKGVLFLDEINQAHPSVLNAIFQLILDRKIAGESYVLPDQWVIVSACNDFEHNRNVTEFEPPLNDRFLHILYQPSAQAFLDYANKAGYNKRVIQYITNNKSAFLSSPSDMADTMAFPTPRSWKRVSDLEDLWDSNSITNIDVFQYSVAGLIGSATASMYLYETEQSRMISSADSLSEEDLLFQSITSPQSFSLKGFLQIASTIHSNDYFKTCDHLISYVAANTKILDDPADGRYRVRLFKILAHYKFPLEKLAAALIRAKKFDSLISVCKTDQHEVQLIDKRYPGFQQLVMGIK